MNKLEEKTVKLISTSQVITSVPSVIKELLENAIDANSTSIEVKLENYGMTKIEVRDNGCGIKSSHMPYIAQLHYTSKISSFADLNFLQTYGFRGEALGSLCCIADLSITSKTANDEVSQTYNFNHDGHVVSVKPSHYRQGTCVAITNLFRHLPVRKTYFSGAKKQKEEMKEIEKLVVVYSLVHRNTRFSLSHNGSLIMTKMPSFSTRQALLSVLGHAVLNHLKLIAVTDADSQISIEAYIPDCQAPTNITSRSSNDHCYCYVNKRPVFLKSVDKLIKKYYYANSGCERSRYPIYFIHLTIPQKKVDVNLTPDKRLAFIEDQVCIIKLLENVFKSTYGNLPEEEISANPAGKESSNQSMNNSCLVICNAFDNANSFKNIKIGSDASDIASIELNVNDDSELHDNCDSGNSSKKRRVNDDTLNKVSSNLPLNIDGKFSLSDSPSKNQLIVNLNDISYLSDSECDLIDPLDVNNKVDLFTQPTVMQQANGETVTLSNTSIASFEANNKLQVNNLEEILSTQGNVSCIDKRMLSSDYSLNALCADSMVNANSTIISETTDNISFNRDLLNSDHHEYQKIKLTENCNDQANKISGGNNLLSWTRGETYLSSKKQPVSILTNAKLENNASTKQAKLPFLMKRNPASSIKGAQSCLIDVSNLFGIGNQNNDSSTAHCSDDTLCVKHKWDENANASVKKTKHVQDVCVNVADRTAGKFSTNILLNTREYRSCSIVQWNWKLLYDRTTPLFEEDRLKSAPGKISIVGPFKSHNLWLALHCSQLFVFNPTLIQEYLIFENLMNSYILSTNPLDPPVMIESKTVGDKLYTTLCGLNKAALSSQQCYYIFSDERITFNGLQVAQRIDNSQILLLQSHRSVNINIGIEELKEILQKICCNQLTNVSQCRPSCLISYLKAESKRMTNQMPVLQTKEDISETILDTLEEVLRGNIVSDEKLNYFVDICDINTKMT